MCNETGNTGNASALIIRYSDTYNAADTTLKSDTPLPKWCLYLAPTLGQKRVSQHRLIMDRTVLTGVVCEEMGNDEWLLWACELRARAVTWRRASRRRGAMRWGPPSGRSDEAAVRGLRRCPWSRWFLVAWRRGARLKKRGWWGTLSLLKGRSELGG